MLKNLFQKYPTKIRTDLLDRVLSEYEFKNNKILLKPFNNSYGIILENLSEKIGFMKGSLDIVYPKIIRKKYQIRMKQQQSEKTKNNNDTLKSNSLENTKSNKNKNIVKDDLYIIINKDKKASQSIHTKYPKSVKIKGKITPNMYSFRGQNHLYHKILKQNLFINKVN